MDGPATESAVPVALLTALSAASLLTWGHALELAWHRGTPLFPTREACPVRLPPWVTAGAAAALALFLLEPLASALRWLAGVPQPPQPEATLLGVQLQCGLNLVLTAAFLAGLSRGPGTLRDHGFWLDPIGPQLRDAALGLLLILGPVFLALVMSQRLGLRGTEPEHQLLRMLSDGASGSTWFWIVLTAVVSAPLVEELLFRVLLLGALAERLPAATAIGISALAFCVVHRFPDSLALVPFALVQGFIQYRRRSYVTVVVIHAAFNGLNLLLLALTSGEAPSSS